MKMSEEAKATDLLPEESDRSWNRKQYLKAVWASTFRRADGSQVFGTGLTGAKGNYFY